ncbi:type VI secretion system Vgr family protein [Trinickia dinghuensis]|uniref:Type VI secretion system tip protein VgrG n=1 Tax=Trinickia dinghuensis TaxID=2291023 RepID=A0A3D8K074_9BURK|nr:type VI secretion system Vgr family protein [Trinickia dinghuensis]RDU98306.1 type VI secretion system tip protein VgrG [Trinickia dinghuensis]
MSYSASSRASFGPLPSQKNRAIRLKWGDRESESELEDLLLPQRIEIRESLFGGIDGCVSCVSTSSRIPLNTFIGLPVQVQFVTDLGGLHPICGIIVDAREGESDGALAVYQLYVRDALSILERRVNTRIFRRQSALDVIQTLVGEWRSKSAVLAGAFYLDASNVDRAKLPEREQTIQFDESDAAFIRRLCRREGIGWFVRAGKPGNKDAGVSGDTAHTLVLYDNAIKLKQSAIGSVAYRFEATIGKRDAVTLLCAARQLVPGAIRRFSWDYKPGRMDRVQGPTRVDQGKAGNDLARLLMDSRIDAPHIADSWGDYDRLGLARVLSHGARAVRVDGASGIRDLAIGEWVEVTGYGEFDGSSKNNRRIAITSLHHRAENNLPKDLNERAQALFTASRWSFDSPSVSVDTPARPTVYGDSSQSRYENTFSGVPRGTPLTPAFDPHVDRPRVYPIVGVVVTPEGEEVFCDQYGRINVQLQGLDPADHEHAHGMGTSGTSCDSAWVRVATGLAGDNFGENWLPRKGMEVLLDFLGGDPDKMYVAGVFHNGPNMPATFSNTGSLPGNRYVSGTKTREVKGRRYNQLRFDDTPSQISVQLASEHRASEINLGYLTHPRTNGIGDDRGEGAELRTDAAAALRAAKGILLTTYARNKAQGHQLDRDELSQLLTECLALFKSLGDYAGKHRGSVPDAAGQKAVADALENWQASGAGNAKGVMAFGAEAGAVHVTPKTHVTYAGENIDQIAQQSVQVASGQRINLQAGHGVAMFAHRDGVSAIANHGKLTLQSQADDTQIDSAKNIQMIAAGGKLAGAASEEVVLVTSGGAYLKLRGGDIELGCPGSFTVKAASHTWGGAASMRVDMPKFDHAPLGRVPKLVRATDGQAAAGFDAEIKTAAGDLLNQKTDGAGRLPLVNSDQFERLVVQFFKKKI